MVLGGPNGDALGAAVATPLGAGAGLTGGLGTV
jgi:hypothetical protein